MVKAGLIDVTNQREDALRSLLLARADSAGSLDSALASGADALIIDLQAQDDAASTRVTRHLARDFLTALQLEAHRPLVYVRLPAIDAETIDEDLMAVIPGEPDGILLGRCRSGRDVQHLGAKLAVQEAEDGLAEGSLPILAEACAHASSLFELGSYRDCSSRLVALSWNADALAADLGLESGPRRDGRLPSPLETARSMLLFAARAADVAALDGPDVGLSPEAFKARCLAARADGFNGKVAASLDEVAAINAAFDREG